MWPAVKIKACQIVGKISGKPRKSREKSVKKSWKKNRGKSPENSRDKGNSSSKFAWLSRLCAFSPVSSPDQSRNYNQWIWEGLEAWGTVRSAHMVALARFSTFNILFRAVISPLKVVRSRSLKFSLSSCVQIMCSTKKSFERLPTNVVPKNYALTLQPNLTEFSFTGKEVIEVEVSIRIFHFFFDANA